MKHIYALIMAGGVGERFWPRSRRAMPKQLLDLTGSGLSMLALTVQRVQPLIAVDHISVITHETQKAAVHQAVPQLQPKHIIGEPIGRNTTACVALGAALVALKDPESVMVVLPADHWIPDALHFQETLKVALHWAAQDKLVTIGMKPDHPETEYGYIEAGVLADDTQPRSYRIASFKEKPDAATAQQFLHKGHYFWNSGMFVWKAKVILEEVAAYAPAIYEGVQTIAQHWGQSDQQDVFHKIYSSLPGVPVDIAVMEKSQRGMMVEGLFSWNDLGLWTAVAKMHKAADDCGNICANGDYVVVDAHNNFMHTDQGIIALLGVSDCVVVRTEKAVLVCHKDRAKDVKLLVAHMKATGREEHL